MAGTHDIARASGLKYEQVEEVFSQIMNAVERGDKVRINGFGTFSRGLYKARTLTTPAVNDGKPMELPETNTLKFKQSNQAKVRLNKPKKSSAKKTSKKAAAKKAPAKRS